MCRDFLGGGQMSATLGYLRLTVLFLQPYAQKTVHDFKTSKGVHFCGFWSDFKASSIWSVVSSEAWPADLWGKERDMTGFICGSTGPASGLLGREGFDELPAVNTMFNCGPIVA